MKRGNHQVEPIYSRFGQLVRRRRIEKKLSQTKVASTLGISRVSLVNIEMGRQRIMLGDAVDLANLLALSLSELQQEFKGERLQKRISEEPKQVRKALQELLGQFAGAQ